MNALPNNSKSPLSLLTDPNFQGAGVDEEQAQSASLVDHYANLADIIDADEISERLNDLFERVEDDIESHSPYVRQHAALIDQLGFDRSRDSTDEPDPGSSGLVNPIMAKAGTDISARIMAQFWPASGPVRCEVVGKPTPGKEAKAERVKEYISLQLSQLIQGYRATEDMMVTHLPFLGSSFKKVYWDGAQICTEYFQPEDVIIPYHAASLEKAERITNRLRMSKNEVTRLQRDGFYSDIDLPAPGMTEQTAVDKAHDRIQGQTPPSNEQELYEIFEVHCLLELPEIEKDAGPLPYVVTYVSDTKTVLRISRNWDIEDTNKTRDEVFVAYGLVPWRGVYSIGLPQQIGGLCKSSTGALQALLDASMKHNNFYGVRLKGPAVSATSAATIKLSPGEIAQIDTPSSNITDINQIIKQFPFPAPDPTLFELMKYCEEQAGSFANINSQMIADSTNTGPVGTTYALIDEASKVFNSIFARLHESKRKELRIIHRLNYRHLNDNETVQKFGGELVVSRQDFDDEIDVLPVSDPNSSTSSQRIAKMGAIFEAAEKLPGIFDSRKLLMRAMDLMGMQDAEDLLLPVPPDATPRDPVSNVQAILSGMPVDAFPGQDADSHIAVYLEFAQSPLFGANPLVAPVLNPPLGKLLLAFLKLRAGTLYGHVLSGNPMMSIPVGLSAPPQAIPAQNQMAQKMAAEAGWVLKADIELAGKLLPIVQKAMSFVPPQPGDPLMVSALAEQDKVQSDSRKDVMEAALKAADIQSAERIAENAQDNANLRSLITAIKALPPGVTLWSHLPQDIPDEMVGVVRQIEQLRSIYGGGAPSQAAQGSSQGVGNQPAPPIGGPGNVVPPNLAQATLNQAADPNATGGIPQ